MPAGILPVHLLEEIISRLEVKTLISLTIICKSLLALISSQSFVKTHLSHYHLNPNTHLLLIHPENRDTITISTLNFFKTPSISIVPIPISESSVSETPSTSVPPPGQDHQEPKDSKFSLVDSINGLVCFSRPRYDNPTNVLIWNPATHRFKDIKVPHLKNLSEHFYVTVAFGFDCVGDDYKIVCLYRCDAGDGRKMSIRFHMYSCNNDSWKELDPGFDIHLVLMRISCVAVKGNPFWLGYECETKEEIWLTVDVGSEMTGVFSGPKYIQNSDSDSHSMTLGDKAAQIVYSPGAEPNDLINVYALEDNSGVWTLMYTIRPMGLQMPIELECYKNGKFVLFDEHGKLFKYDSECGEVKDLGIGEGMEGYNMTINYIESLVSINGMERVREEAALAGKETGKETGLATTDRDASAGAMIVERIE